MNFTNKKIEGIDISRYIATRMLTKSEWPATLEIDGKKLTEDDAINGKLEPQENDKNL